MEREESRRALRFLVSFGLVLSSFKEVEQICEGKYKFCVGCRGFGRSGVNVFEWEFGNACVEPQDRIGSAEGLGSGLSGFTFWLCHRSLSPADNYRLTVRI